MDHAIRIRTSKLELAAQLSSGLLACYWLYLFHGPWWAKVTALGLLLWVLIRSYSNWRNHSLKGRFFLTQEGLVQADTTASPKPAIYQLRLRQRLPWCLQLEVEANNKNFQTLIWRDALNRADWCRLRRYLTLVLHH